MKKKTTKPIELVEEVKEEIVEVKKTIPFTRRFEYYNDNGRHLIVIEGRIVGEKKSDRDAQEFANKFNAEQKL